MIRSQTVTLRCFRRGRLAVAAPVQAAQPRRPLILEPVPKDRACNVGYVVESTDVPARLESLVQAASSDNVARAG